MYHHANFQEKLAANCGHPQLEKQTNGINAKMDAPFYNLMNMDYTRVSGIESTTIIIFQIEHCRKPKSNQ